MGRGDLKTKKGKRTRGSYGNSRPKKSGTSLSFTSPKPKKEADSKPKKASAAKPKKTTAKKAAPKKATKKAEPK